MKAGEKTTRSLDRASVTDLLGQDLVHKLKTIRAEMHGELYLAGGTVRDLIMVREPVDIDLTVSKCAKKWASRLVELTGATFVALGRDEDAARVVWRGRNIDFSSFREGAQTIDEELAKRDITVNSMALCLDAVVRNGNAAGVSRLEIIDPVNGITDLAQGTIRLTSERSIASDPLRMLRVFRFAATLGFSVDPDTFNQVVRQKELITRPASERVAYELDLIMCSARAHATISDLARSGLLFVLVPELEAGKGMEQPSSHHLDVFDHCMATLACMEKVQKEPEHYFPGYGNVLAIYIQKGRNRVQLRWAALLHDLGKPLTVTIDEDRGGRITFYNHDRTGAELVETVGRRLKWSSSDIRAVGKLVGLHMRPFHLCNVQRKQELSLKACLRLVRLAEADQAGLFLLSMADALAGKGEGRPEEVEREVAQLFSRLEAVRREHVERVRSGPPLLTGRDLIDELGLEPGPLFRKILDAVEVAQMERSVMNRQEALDFVRQFFKTG